MSLPEVPANERPVRTQAEDAMQIANPLPRSVSPQTADEPGNELPRSVSSQTEEAMQTQVSTPPVRTPETPKPALLKHKVLLLADEDLSPSDLLFLERILKAVNLDIEGVDLLNVYGVSDVDFAAVLRHKYINHFITFGVPFQRINLDIMMDRYQPVRFDGITFLMADSLPVIEANQTLKKLLWNSLKRIFDR